MSYFLFYYFDSDFIILVLIHVFFMYYCITLCPIACILVMYICIGADFNPSASTRKHFGLTPVF